PLSVVSTVAQGYPHPSREVRCERTGVTRYSAHGSVTGIDAACALHFKVPCVDQERVPERMHEVENECGTALKERPGEEIPVHEVEERADQGRKPVPHLVAQPALPLGLGSPEPN